jgi:hypothetical protein
VLTVGVHSRDPALGGRSPDLRQVAGGFFLRNCGCMPMSGRIGLAPFPWIRG